MRFESLIVLSRLYHLTDDELLRNNFHVTTFSILNILRFPFFLTCERVSWILLVMKKEYKYCVGKVG